MAVFEPRSNTSRRAVFQREYAEAFDAAARVVVRCVPDAPIYSAFGGDPERLSAEQLARDISARGVPCVALRRRGRASSTHLAELRARRRRW